MALNATFQADFSDFQNAVSAADAKLVDFQKDGAKVEQQLNRVADSLSGRKLVSDATIAAKAVESIGGAGMLTEKELARLGAQASEASAKLKAMGMDVPPHIQAIADEARRANTATSSWLGDFGSQLKATALGMISAQAIIGTVKAGVGELSEFVRSSIKDYAEAEAALKKMTTALEAQGTASALNIQDFKSLGAEFQRTSVNSHVATTEMEALLVQVGGVAPGAMKKTLQAAMDLSAGLGIDLRAATILVAKASEENVAALKKAGVQLDTTRVQAEGMDYILGELNKRFGGQAQAEIETYGGKIKQLGNDWDDFKEAVGKSIVQDPLIVKALQDAQEEMRGTGEAAGKATPSITEFMTALVAPTSASTVAYLSDATREIPSLETEIDKLKPPDPAAFTGFGKDLEALFKQADADAKAMAESWVQIAESEAKAHAQEVKDINERNKLWAESNKLQTQLIDDIQTNQRKQGASENEQLRLDLNDRRDKEIAAARANTKMTTDEIETTVALIKVKYAGLVDAIGLDMKLISGSSLQTAIDQRDNALKTYLYMSEHADQYTKGALDAQLQKYRDLALAATASGRAMTDGENAAAAAAQAHLVDLEKEKKKLEEIEAAARKANLAMGGSFGVTSSNLDTTVAGMSFGSSGNKGNVGNVDALARAGYSFEEIVAILNGGKKGTPVGPRIPGFIGGVDNFSGGRAIVGEGGPEMVDLPRGSSVIPFGRGGGGSNPVTVNVHVNGVFDPKSKYQLSEAVSDAVARQLSLTRLL